MERVSLRDAFHGEPDSEQDGIEVLDKGPDQVTLKVKSGRLILRVPKNTPDDQVISREFMDQFMQLTLELEEGSQLTLILDESQDLVDVQLVPASERGQESEG